jgi:transposase
VTDLDTSSLLEIVDSHKSSEICNYFNNRTNSGVTEGINTRIKLIIRQSYGFKNFDMMKEKLLACLFKEVPLCYTSLNKPNLSP